MEISILKKRSVLLYILVLLPLTFALAQPHPSSYTLETVMSCAFPSNLVTSPQGDIVAWVYNWQGKRNIWVAKGPDYKAQQLTQYSLDDGQELGQLAFSSDGTTLVFVRGGSANRAGENPNPTSNPAGAEQAVWAIKVESGESWKIWLGSNPLPSPAGKSLVYTFGNQIYLASTDRPSKPELLFKARGNNGTPTWSPDGSKLAFVSGREDHSFIGVYDIKNKSLKWISPSVDRDGYPVWSPCGKYIAFIRFPGMSSAAFFTGARFSLMKADVETGEAQEIWQCPNETGGFSQSYPAKTLRWAADGLLVFYSEHEKWMHLYSLSCKDKKLVCLTPGEYEVEDSFLSKDGKTLIFNSNSADIDRRHLWSVPVKGGEPKLLTPGQGIEWSPILTSNSNDLVFFCSTFSQPAAPAAMDLKGKKRRILAPEAIPSEFPLQELVEPQQVVIKAPDGLEVHCQLFVSKGAKPGDKRPAVIFMHGGPIRQMLLGWHMREYYHNSYALNQYLVSKGYLVLSVNYRSGIGYGFDFRTAPNQGPRGASEYQDIVAAGRYLQKRPEVDPNKIGLWGGSYGGYLTALGLARDSELFAAGVDLHGVHDWSSFGRSREGAEWGIQGEELMNMAYQSSPVADVYFWSSPVLFVHGDDDRNVDFVQTTDLVQRLRKLGKAHVELLVFPDEVHSFLRHDTWLKVYRAAADFFDRFLKNKNQ
jgi:dipeptidyl-peptidase-4